MAFWKQGTGYSNFVRVISYTLELHKMIANKSIIPGVRPLRVFNLLKDRLSTAQRLYAMTSYRSPIYTSFRMHNKFSSPVAPSVN